MLDKDIYKPKSKMIPDRSGWSQVSRKLDFLSRVSIRSISIHREGLCDFCMDDGNYFHGLTIYIRSRFDGTMLDVRTSEGHCENITIIE